MKQLFDDIRNDGLVRLVEDVLNQSSTPRCYIEKLRKEESNADTRVSVPKTGQSCLPEGIYTRIHT
ncbi:hypothetical protein Desku_1030 [Desulfofundulus kuznetsovii DSM 6115]|uniref:Uncharacterized protein n=1 Tax=Desulfofundulus kuznetsovii (strain DSM 6115 / VKM B-1805 / 17) TaxID=760568 RepID=A0AAU8PSB1_DESK7|nr:hypothetical protein Desku_1030 [Desulfofundulus kuznetsovii DSM 6115]